MVKVKANLSRLLLGRFPLLLRLFVLPRIPAVTVNKKQERSLLAQLKALILECDTQGTDGLLAKVRALVLSQAPVGQAPADTRQPVAVVPSSTPTNSLRTPAASGRDPKAKVKALAVSPKLSLSVGSGGLEPSWLPTKLPQSLRKGFHVKLP